MEIRKKEIKVVSPNIDHWICSENHIINAQDDLKDWIESHQVSLCNARIRETIEIASCDGHKLHASSRILQKYSGYFKGLLSLGMKESMHGEKSTILEECSFAELKNIVRFLYLGELILENHQELFKLYKIAQFLLMDDLSKALENAFAETINEDVVYLFNELQNNPRLGLISGLYTTQFRSLVMQSARKADLDEDVTLFVEHVVHDFSIC